MFKTLPGRLKSGLSGHTATVISSAAARCQSIDADLIKIIPAQKSRMVVPHSWSRPPYSALGVNCIQSIWYMQSTFAAGGPPIQSTAVHAFSFN